MTDMPPPPPPNMTPPPGYVPYGGYGAVTPGVQKIGGLIKALVILLVILIPAQIVGVLTSLSTIDKAKKYLDSNGTTDFDTAQNPLSSLGSLLIIPIAVLTMIVMYKMANNLKALGRTDATWAPGWAIGGWFVPPCVLYVVPWLMFRELWKGSDPDVAPGDPNVEAGTRRTGDRERSGGSLYGLLPLVHRSSPSAARSRS
jgi:hypothetical protein